MNLSAWLKQPSTITGLAAFAGAAATAVAGILTHSTDLAAGIGAIAFAAVHVALPDNTTEAASVQKLVSDAVHAAVEKRLAASLPQLVSDVSAVVAAAPVVPMPQPAPAPAAPPAAPAAQ